MTLGKASLDCMVARTLSVLGVGLLACVFSSELFAKDLVAISEAYGLASTVEESCARLQKLEQVEKDLAEFISKNPGTEVVAQLVSGQTVTGVNRLKIAEFAKVTRSELQQDAVQKIEKIKRKINELEGVLSEIEKRQLFREIVAAYQTITSEYSCADIEVENLTADITLLKVQLFVEDENNGRRAFEAWLNTELLPALSQQDVCTSAGLLSEALKEYQTLSTSFGETARFDGYKKGEGNAAVSLQELVEAVQKANETCGAVIESRDEQAFKLVVTIAGFRDDLDKVEVSSERLIVLGNIIRLLDKLIDDYPGTTVGQALREHNCYGPRLCLEKFRYEVRQIEYQMTSIEDQGSVELARLTEDATCGKDQKKDLSERIACLKHAMERADVIHDLYRDTKAGRCLSSGAQCVHLQRAAVNKELESLIARCEGEAQDILHSSVVGTEMLNRQEVTLEHKIAALVDIKEHVAELTLRRICSTSAQETLRDGQFGAIKISEIEQRILELSSVIAGIQSEFLKTQKYCARALASPLRISGINKVRVCLEELDQLLGKATPSEISKRVREGGSIIPLVEWERMQIDQDESGQFLVDASVNGAATKLLIDFDQKWTRLPLGLSSQLKLERTIKIPTEVDGKVREYFIVELESVKIGGILLTGVVGLIDPDLDGSNILLGSQSVVDLDVDRTNDKLEIRKGTLVEGSVEQVGISYQGIQESLEGLIAQALTDLDSTMWALEDAGANLLKKRELDDFTSKILSFRKLIEAAQEAEQEFKQVLDLRSDQMTSLNQFLKGSLVNLTTGREEMARELCESLASDVGLITTADSVETMKDAAGSAVNFVSRITSKYSESKFIEEQISSDGPCSVEEGALEQELEQIAKLERASAKLNDATSTRNQEIRMEGYGVVRRLLKEVAENSWRSVISKRVKENDPVDGLSQQVIEELIAVEEEAKGKLNEANRLLEMYLEEDRLPSRYDMLEESHGLFSRVFQSDAAFDAALVTNQMQRIERDLKDLEQRLPIEPETVYLSSGCFEMGGRQNDEDAADDEALHRVCVDDFEIGIYEVTFHEYDRFVRSVGVDAPEDMGWGREYRPIINVSYLDITAYIEWLSYQTDKLFRLPTEAEWEYAARAGKEEIYPWGDKKGTARANCMNCNSDWNGRKTAPVGSFEPNNWGLYDVSGNAAEKTCSTYQSSYQGEEKTCIPLESSGSRVVRGGSWKSHSRNIRLSYRDTIDEIDHRSRFHGFRLVRDN